jgi:anaerobic selenocysteine-containing dehydrogenase
VVVAAAALLTSGGKSSAQVPPPRQPAAANPALEYGATFIRYSHQKVLATSRIDAATIRELARTLARTPRAAGYGRIGTCTQEYGTLSSWLIDVLNVLTGHLDVPGGAMFAKAAAFAANTLGKPGVGKGVATGRHHARVSGAPEVFGELPITCLAEEIDTPGEGQVRALVTVAANPVLSTPDGPRLAAALESLDFMVSMDIYVNETTRHADVILPGVSPLEDMHYDMAFPQLSWRNHARFSPPVLPRAPGQPEEWQTLLTLAAIARGQGPDLDPDALDDAQFAEDAQRMFGAQADAIVAATRHLKGPLRALEVALRAGPYGDGFGTRPD